MKKVKKNQKIKNQLLPNPRLPTLLSERGELPTPYSLLPIHTPYSRLPNSTLLPTPYSLLPTPYSLLLLPTPDSYPYSLVATPYSLLLSTPTPSPY